MLLEQHCYEVVCERDGFSESTPFLLPLVFLNEHAKHGKQCKGVVDAEGEKILVMETTTRQLMCVSMLLSVLSTPLTVLCTPPTVLSMPLSALPMPLTVLSTPLTVLSAPVSKQPSSLRDLFSNQHQVDERI